MAPPSPKGADPFKSGFPLPWEIKVATSKTEPEVAAPVAGKRKAESPVPETEVVNNASVESGELQEEPAAKRVKMQEKNETIYMWYRCECDPLQYHGKTFYFHNKETGASQFDEPAEPYWIWDAKTQTMNHEKGLQQPGVRKYNYAVIDGKVVERYDPKIHGDYDPSQPYAKYHNKLRELESAAKGEATAPEMTTEQQYESIANFNARTGAFQTAERGAERHSDHAKSHRQMSAFFDVDAAANAHGGKSLKEERRQTKYTKEQIRAMNDEKKAKKRKKQMDFLLN